MNSNKAEYISKQESQVLKGVSILLMLFLHLFNQMRNVDLCNTLFFIGDRPLVYILTRASNPVAFFLILGGYGMYIVYKKGDAHRVTRIIKLLIHFWIITIIFITIGHLMFPDRYPGSLIKVIKNFTSYQTTYNGELWFLFPYLFLSLTSQWLFMFANRFRTRYVLIILFILHLFASFLISRYRDNFLYPNYWIYNPVRYINLMFPFFMGAMAAKHRVFSFFSNFNWQLFAWPLLIILIITRCMFETSIINTFYAFVFFFLFLKTRRFQFIDKVLGFLGKHSMNMWMIHSWFCYYLFHDFIYGFKYPVFIFIVLVIISVLCSMIVNVICAPIKKMCKV